MINKLNNIIKLINNENIKSMHRKNIMIVTLLMLFSISLIGLISYSTGITNSNWREMETSELFELQNTSNDEDYDFVKQFDSDRTSLLTYSLDNNIPLDMTTPWHFVHKVNNTFNIIIIFIILLSANTITKEYSYGTIKQILIRPYYRSEILLTKHISLIFITALCIIAHFLLAFIIGHLLFYKNGFSSSALTVLNNSVIEINIINSVLKGYLCLFIESIILISFSLMLSVLLRTNLVSLISTIVLYFFSGIISSSFSKYELFKFTIFPHMKLSQYIYGQNLMFTGNTLTLTIIILFIYFAIFNFISYYSFSKQDIY